MTSPLPPRGLYLITQDTLDSQLLLTRTQRLLEAGVVTWLQYRNRTADAARRREEASALQALAKAAGVPLIINDDLALALEIGADGLHREDSEETLDTLRAALGPQAWLGASCYDQPALAEAAVQAGARYVSFGAFFPSRSKPTTHRATTAVLDATATLGVPRVAIGGLNADNAAPVIDAGADLVAVIGGVHDAADPVEAARALCRLFG